MGKSQYYKGIKFFNGRGVNYEKAENYFWQCLNDPEYREAAFKYLYIMYKKTCNFAGFQNLIHNITFINNDIKLSIANMEMREYNLDSSFSLIMQAMNGELKDDALFLLSKLYIQLGELSEAQAILEKESSFFNKRKVNKKLIQFYFLSGDYEKALYLLYLNPEIYEKDRFYFSRLESLSKLYLHEKPLSYLDKNEIDNFTKSQKRDYVFSLEKRSKKIDLTVVRHIEEHHKLNCNSDIGFYEDINIKKLYEKISKKLDQINYITKDYYYIYRFPLDNMIGMQNSVDTNGIGVVTTPNKRIITMYPITLSQSYNKEGYLENKEILRRRRIKK